MRLLLDRHFFLETSVLPSRQFYNIHLLPSRVVSFKKLALSQSLLFRNLPNSVIDFLEKSVHYLSEKYKFDKF